MNKLVKLSTLMLATVSVGLAVSGNVKADTTDQGQAVATSMSVQSQGSVPATTVSAQSQTDGAGTDSQTATAQSQSKQAAQVASQTVNIPSGYTLDAVKNVSTQSEADELEKTAINGLYNNNYQSSSSAAQESVDLNNLTDSQVNELNQYALNLVNQVRSEFGETPFTQSSASIAATKKMALEYQNKNESLINGNWHDSSIIGSNSENIAAQQIYIDNISGVSSRPFATAVGKDFVDSDKVPLFTISNMDDLRALTYYGIMEMLFNDASDQFGHAQNFLTNYQPISTMGVYPSLTYSTGTGKYANGQTFSIKFLNVDMHYIWVAGDSSSTTSDTGWKYENNQYVYYQNGSPLSGRNYVSLPTINGVGTSWYLVDNGIAQSGVQKWAGTYYYFDPVSYLRVDNNYVQSQWGDWYLFGNDGRILTGVQKWAGTYYYFDPVTYLRVDNNYVQSQWGDWYMFGNDGKIVTGLYKWAGSYYYFDPVTYLRTDNQYVATQSDGRGYLLGKDGIALTGVQKWYGTYYYFDPVTHLRVDNNYVQSQWGDWYMFGNDGKIVTGFYNWMGSTYYFDPVTYLKVTNTYFWVNGVRYWADASGIVSRA